MNRQYVSVILTLLAIVLFTTACNNNERVTTGGQVKASPAYIKAFGQPPVPSQGECLARVGYFPLRSDSTRLRPVPFFLLGERDPLAQLLDRLAGGEVPLNFDTDVFNPFAVGDTLHVVEHRNNGVIIDLHLSSPVSSPETLQAIAAVVTETAAQFEQSATVIIRHDGQPLAGMPAAGFVHDAARIVSPGPPVLFMVAGAWKSDGTGPEEIVANFDRPVTIQNFRLENAAGEELRGNYFQSAFNMSVVLHPAEPDGLVEGMPMTASWEVTDTLDRKGSGRQTFALLRRENVEAR